MFLVSFRIRSSREEPAANCGELRIRDTSPDSLSPPACYLACGPRSATSTKLRQSARRMNGVSGGFCCQVPPNPAWRSLTHQDFKSVFQTALRSLSNRSIVVVGNYCSSPITAEQYREKARPLRPRRSCFAPAEARPSGGLGWRRRVLPPGPNGLLRRRFISIAGEPAPSI